MSRRNKSPQLSETQLAEYQRFFDSCQMLDDQDIATLAARWPHVQKRVSYKKAAERAANFAYGLGRIDADDIVAGPLTDPDAGEISKLIDVVDGGPALDVAIAVLVRDELDPADYRILTAWWGKPESTWLPDTGPQPAEPEPEAEPEPAAEPEPVDRLTAGPAPAGNARPGPAADLGQLGIVDEPQPQPQSRPVPAAPPRPGPRPAPAAARPLPRPKGQPPRQRSRTLRPAGPEAEEVLRLAHERALRDAERRSRARRFNAAGAALTALAVICGVFMAANQLNPGYAFLPPAGWVGPWYGALTWLIIGGLWQVAAMRCFTRARAARNGEY